MKAVSISTFLAGALQLRFGSLWRQRSSPQSHELHCSPPRRDDAPEKHGHQRRMAFAEEPSSRVLAMMSRVAALAEPDATEGEEESQLGQFSKHVLILNMLAMTGRMGGGLLGATAGGVERLAAVHLLFGRQQHARRLGRRAPHHMWARATRDPRCCCVWERRRCVPRHQPRCLYR